VQRLPFGAFFGEPRGGVDLGGFTVGEFVDRPQDPVFRHTHEDAHFWFVLKGQYISSAAGLPEVCGPPAAIFVPAGTTHRDRFHTRGGSFMALSIRPSLIERLGGHRALGDHAVGFTGGELAWLGRRLHHELRHADASSPLVMEGLGLELLAHAARDRQRRSAHAEPWLPAAFELVNDCYRERLTVQGLAAALGVPPLQLGRAFRRALGCSPGEMVRRRRVARAEELLREGHLPLADIALASGFADQAQLTKAFRRATGFTPGRYRRLFCSN
jgi:AraC family transcriptional regulator